MDWQPLITAALKARDNAYAPYSGFKVGAALLTDSGQLVSGCNVENRSFGGTVCAERVAVGTAIAAGATAITALAVVTDSTPPAPPCGLCLQVVAEFASQDLPVLLQSTNGESRECSLSDLHPQPFELPAQGLGLQCPGS